MRFYVIGRWGKEPPGNAEYPCATLNTDSWNDYGWETLFHLTFWPEPHRPLKIGEVKILQEGKSIKLDPEGGVRDTTTLPPTFTHLEPGYGALGQDRRYYRVLEELGPTGRTILKALRDMVYDREIGRRFEKTLAFEQSLMRNSEAAHNYYESGIIFGSPAVPRVRRLDFRFAHQVEGFGSEHRVECRFVFDDPLPQRVMAFIGKNGTGKTAVMAELAWQLSGMAKERSGFLEGRPTFSRVIVISYSPFGPFRFPDRTSSSYRYCGAALEQTQTGVRKRLLLAIEEIRELGRTPVWLSALHDAGLRAHEPVLARLDFDLSAEAICESLGRLSSGHFIAAAMITEIVANLLTGSLLLIDEPELFLHPNLVSGLMRALDTLLDPTHFDSCAIVATHSPIVVQEIPSRSVRLFSRVDDDPMCITPGFESFGENLTTIVNQIFGATRSDKNYMRILDELSKNRTDEQIDAMFEFGLGLNAMSYVNSVTSGRRDGPA